MEIGKNPGPGRPKGAKNKRNKAVEAAVAAAGITPLEFMMNVLRDDSAPREDRKWAAQNAAPYVHAKLTASDLKIDANVSFGEVVSGADAIRSKIRQSNPVPQEEAGANGSP